MWRTVSTILLAATLILPLAVYATPHNSDYNQKPTATTIVAQRYQDPMGNRMEKIFDQLDLTPQQSEEIDAIIQQSHNENADLKQQLQQTHEQMRSLFDSDASTAQLQQQHQQLQNLRQQLGDRRFNTMLQIREVLTPQQLTQLTQLREQYHRNRRNRSYE